MKRWKTELRRYFPLTLRDTLTALGILGLASLVCFLLQAISATDAGRTPARRPFTTLLALKRSSERNATKARSDPGSKSAAEATIAPKTPASR